MNVPMDLTNVLITAPTLMDHTHVAVTQAISLIKMDCNVTVDGYYNSIIKITKFLLEQNVNSFKFI